MRTCEKSKHPSHLISVPSVCSSRDHCRKLSRTAPRRRRRPAPAPDAPAPAPAPASAAAGARSSCSRIWTESSKWGHSCVISAS